ncbi:NEL-type E3 ubiquitin ligase domain-containing protein [Pseudomonas sp. CC120222-01a]|uniref:NEL-type E3 ubiquitin ligase domain-containing protein n=1 Tax=Pseudomonas sp. CC120222-01a TaxID=1378075 RepID=UPI000D972C76|nr:NEL-type E3 ubiquitin ligase domain-containing protein [Pseudomonas sp. CC120222-01a]PVZ41784.1 leucine rich repeat (LRR) protein [Pseudomonas sp. CC120222-01a]
MPSADIYPSDSVDHLIARRLPDWIATAQTQHVEAYHKALREQQQVADQLRHLLSRIPSVEDFGAPLLEKALAESGLGHVDPRHAFTVVTEEFSLPSAAEKFHHPTVTYTTRQSLLASAMHNFEAHEAEPWLLRKAYLVDGKKARLKMSFERFVKLCRTLDIGGRYQALLKTVLQPKAGRGQPVDQARKGIDQLFQDGVRTQMKAALYEARIKGQLDERDLQRLLPLLERPPLPAYQGGTLSARQLYLLGTPMVGVIALEWRPAPDAAIDEVILWLPGDPEKSLRHYDAWEQVYADLATRMSDKPLRNYLRRFVRARDRQRFDTALSRALAAAAPAKPLELDGRNLPVDGELFSHAQAQVQARLYDDARYVAVPTDDEDRLSRHRRLQAMEAAGLDLLGLAALFVPVLGELLLVVSAVQLLDEVYEGYRNWQLGDRQGALDHVFNVVEGLALAGATGAVLHGVKRVSWVGELEPKVLPAGSVRLRRNPHFLPRESNPLVMLQGLPGWDFADMLSSRARILLDATGLQTDQLRRLALERGAAPARLLDMHELLELHAAQPGLRGPALEQARQPASPEQGKLMKAFSGLTPRGAQEIIDHSSSAVQQQLLTESRIPLGMAERARWYVRDSRVDRACLGVRLPEMLNADGEKLIFGLIERKAPWPDSVRVELRVGSRDGLLLCASQGEAASETRVIIKHDQAYALDSGTGSPGSLLQAMVQCLDDDQKMALGNIDLQMSQLRDTLLESAANDREQAAKLMGLVPRGAGVRPPRRFADGRLAYRLSGDGESSRQAIRRGIHQIFPTLSEMQLEAYMEAVRQRGENLWDHYQMLQRQLTQLREVLRQWQADWRTPIDAIRRRRVADTLRRSWRRKLVDGNDQYELTLDGEHVDALPSLPAGIDYVHVRRLALRNMNLLDIDASFLRLFPNVVDLDLSGNRLSRVPEGIERLTQLRRLNLGNNQIILDEAASGNLARLQLLDTLILSYNPLNGMPDLTALPHVRDVRLRSTGQADMAVIHQRVALRAHIDLRDNRISELQREMRGLRLRLQRLNLHENPLNESSAAYLDEARGVSESSARGGASYSHEAVDVETRAEWVASRDETLRARREATWDRLIEEPGSAGLFRFLADFVEGEDFEAHPRHYRRRVWHILDACEHNEALREQLFREADAPRSCDDRLLLMLNQMEVGILAYQGIDGVPVAVREARFLRLGRQLHRLDLLDEIAARHVQRLRAEGLVEVDEIETRLYYRSRLATVLDLPASADRMHFASFAHVSHADLSHAELDVLRADTSVAMLDALVQRPFWQNYLRETYPERFQALTAPFHERMESLEVQATTGQESDYARRTQALMHEHEADEMALMRSLTTEAWARRRSVG